jgi:hypothetical protein
MFWRKWLLDFCRIQAPILSNNHLSRFITDPDTNLPRCTIYLENHKLYKVDVLEIADLYNEVYNSPMSCSVLSYFLRAESSAYISECLELRQNGINKETTVALHFDPTVEQALDYEWIEKLV